MPLSIHSQTHQQLADLLQIQPGQATAVPKTHHAEKMIRPEKTLPISQANKSPTYENISQQSHIEKTQARSNAPQEKTLEIPYNSGKSTLFQSVSLIAEQVGYVGLSQYDVQQAYASGKSLLADYNA